MSEVQQQQAEIIKKLKTLLENIADQIAECRKIIRGDSTQ
jgi:hypothetical protein